MRPSEAHVARDHAQQRGSASAGDGRCQSASHPARSLRAPRDPPERARFAGNASAIIGRFEGNYGLAFGNANNWGAIQCSSPPPCPPTCVELTDTHADGSTYQWCYRRYPTSVDGAADLVRELYRRDGVPEALASGDAARIANRMRASRYFEAPEARYAKAIATNATTIATNLGEPLVVAIGGVPTPAPPPGAPPAPPGTRTSTLGPAVITAGALGAAFLILLRAR